MKKYVTTLLLLFIFGGYFCLKSAAQIINPPLEKVPKPPPALTYQGEARDSKGDIIKNATLEILFIIKKSETATVSEWKKPYKVTTDKYGLFAVVLGDPDGKDADFNDIPWSESPMWLEVIVTYKGADINMGAYQFLSVPYAMHAETADYVINDNTNDDDADPNNEIQNLSLTNNTLSLTKDGSVNLSGYLDNTDAQAISLAENTLSISGNASTVNLSGYLDNTDAQAISLAPDNTLSITGNASTVDLSDFVTPWVSRPGNVIQYYGDRVGIGTFPAGDGVLHTAGNIVVGVNGSGGTYGVSAPDKNAGLGFIGGDESSGQIYLYGPEHTLYPGEVHLKAGSSNRIIINDDGKVGIGNSSPVYHLDVIGDINLTGTLLKNGLPINIDDDDADPLNEIQTLSLDGNSLSLSKEGGTVNLDDGDADPLNEIQTLSLDGNSLSLSNEGGTVNLPNVLPAGTAENDLISFDGTNWVAKSAVIQNTGSGDAESNMQPYLAVNYIIALQGVFPSRNQSEPFIAEIVMFGSNFAPRGWAFCDGQLLPINLNTALFSLIGTTYGGDGETTFALPDLRGRTPIHAGQSAGPGLSQRTLGEKGGTETLSIDVLPEHSHVITYE